MSALAKNDWLLCRKSRNGGDLFLFVIFFTDKRTSYFARSYSLSHYCCCYFRMQRLTHRYSNHREEDFPFIFTTIHMTVCLRLHKFVSWSVCVYMFAYVCFTKEMKSAKVNTLTSGKVCYRQTARCRRD